MPQPVSGLVIRYAYLWRDDYLKGMEEGVKDRPCAVILVTTNENGEQLVTVLPVTHSPPSNPELAVEIPHQTKLRLGLDDERSWIILTEANRFVWPGPDLRKLGDDVSSVSYGLLPHALFKEVTRKFLLLVKKQRPEVVPRTE